MLVVCPQCAARYRLSAEMWPTGIDSAGQPQRMPRKVRCRSCATVWMALPEEDILELGAPLAAADQPPPPAPVPAPPHPAPDAPATSAPDAPATALSPSPLAARRWQQPSTDGPAAAGGNHWADAEPEEQADGDDEPAHGRRWRVVAALAAAVVGVALILSAVVRPEGNGHYRVAGHEVALPGWADPEPLLRALPDLSLPQISLPGVSLPQLSLPQLSLPTVRVPTTSPPPLKLAISAQRRLVDGRTVWDVEGTLSNPTADAHAVPAIALVLVNGEGESLGRWVVRPSATRLAPGAATRFESSAIDPPPAATGVRAFLKPAGIGRL